jgi:two-component system invasion response regulator UvrY
MPQSKHSKKKFLLVDDHMLIRSGLKLLLTEAYADTIIEEAENGTGIIEKLTNSSYSLIITDIQMPNTETLWLINYIHLNHPSIPVLVYSMTPENIYAVRVLKAGAKGFISKESSMEELKRAIDLALNGKTYISLEVAEQVSLQGFKLSDTPFSILSPRELQIVSLLLAGNTVSQISTTLRLKISTVSTHKGRMFQKLKVTNVLDLKKISDIYRV